jgi:Gpi18-like mannosyltransferase
LVRNVYGADIILISIVFLFIALVSIYLNDKKRYVFSEKKEKIIFLAIISIGLLIRVGLAPIMKGHSTDVLCFSYWADFVAAKGLSNFYTSGIFVDYPPAYIYVLFLIGKLQHILSISMTSSYMLLLIKLPSIVADIMIGCIVYRLAKNSLKGIMPLLLTSLYIFNPAVIINSAGWAQIDGFYTLFIILMMLYIYKNKITIASVIFIVSALIKPQSLIFTPILLCAFFESKDWKGLIKSAIFSVITAAIIIIPFTGSQKPLWIIDKYASTIASYPYASVNAFNLFALSNGNWMSYKNSFLFLDYKSWGSIFIILITLFSIYIYFKGKEKHKIFYIAYFIINAVFVLSSKMHERYLFPALALGIMLYIYSKEKKILYSVIGITVTNFINVAYVLKSNNLGINFIENGTQLVNIIAIMNIVLLSFIVWIGINIYCKGSTITFVCNKYEINKRDFYMIISLITIYFVIALINLGSVKVPENYWRPITKDEQVIADIGNVKDLERVYYFPGLGGGKYKIYGSIDKENWQEVGSFDGQNIYVWKYVETPIKARYIKISCEELGGRLNEVGIFEKGDNKKLNVRDESNSKLFDEQATVEYNPSYLNGMYFDEIYHARTAYEHLNKLSPYEWTHPPLGKILISVGIFFFGMNPFGWRIIGTLIGVVMIPLIYLFALKIFKKSKFAFIAAFLMTFDFMHFTQTRIATIDVYATFFIILMYYFMYKFVSCDFYHEKFKKSLTYLMLSGISFGLGAASKWSCLYGGVGLALILFFYLIFKYKEIKTIKKTIDINNIETSNIDKLSEKYLNMKKVFNKNTSKIIVYGVLFFIIVPIVIYVISYIPYMLVPGSKGLVEVLDYQKRMYEYHSTLVATHPFSSPWWEWPIIKKPIWYYTGQGYIPTGKVSSIVSMGNPAIWWTGIISVFLTAIIAIKERDKRGAYILIAIASQYVPWMLVPRLIFIYHFFATVPFVILSIVYVIEWSFNKYKKVDICLGVYLLAVVVLFIMFYPIMSGLTVDKTYVSKFLRWFQSWYFYS